MRRVNQRNHCPAQTSPVSEGLVRIWIAQRKLLRLMDEHRQLASLPADSFAVEVVTDGYYLVRKNLHDLMALNRDLPFDPIVIKSNSQSPFELDRSAGKETETSTIVAQDLAALHSLAAEYAQLQAEAAAAKATEILAVVQEHSRQLKSFLTNLFPERLSV